MTSSQAVLAQVRSSAAFKSDLEKVLALPESELASLTADAMSAGSLEVLHQRAPSRIGEPHVTFAHVASYLVAISAGYVDESDDVDAVEEALRECMADGTIAAPPGTHLTWLNQLAGNPSVVGVALSDRETDRYLGRTSFAFFTALRSIFDGRKALLGYRPTVSVVISPPENETLTITLDEDELSGLRDAIDKALTEIGRMRADVAPKVLPREQP